MEKEGRSHLTEGPTPGCYCSLNSGFAYWYPNFFGHEEYKVRVLIFSSVEWMHFVGWYGDDVL